MRKFRSFLFVSLFWGSFAKILDFFFNQITQKILGLIEKPFFSSKRNKNFILSKKTQRTKSRPKPSFRGKICNWGSDLVFYELKGYRFSSQFYFSKFQSQFLFPSSRKNFTSSSLSHDERYIDILEGLLVRKES